MEFEEVDENFLRNHQWVVRFKESMLQLASNSINKWCKTIIELGEDQIELDNWLKIYTKNVQDIHEALFEDVYTMKHKTIDKITDSVKRISELTSCLGLEEVNTYSDLNLSENLYNVEKILRQRTEELEIMYRDKKQKLDVLIEKEVELCKMLEENCCIIPSNQLLSQQFEILQQHIEYLEQLKYEREENYLKLKESIIKMAKELDLTPKSEFEREILTCNSNLEFNISKTNMKELEIFHSDLEKRIEDMKDEIDQLKKSVEYLWSVLEESIREREAFFENYQDYSIHTLKALRAEVKRCEASKRANIKIFVEKAKKEIKDLWRICYHAPDTFGESWFLSDTYTEDLLALHEMELGKWRDYYSSNEELLKLFAEHEKFWNHLLKLENADGDGMNRYKNRGGQLLKEEKERNKLNKNIPKIEERIKQLASEYENANGKPFMIFNEPIMSYIDDLHCQRDEEKKNKLSARKQKPTPMKERTTPAKSCVSLFPSTSRLFNTPRSAVKLTSKISSATKQPNSAMKLSTIESKYSKAKLTSIKKAKTKLNLSSVSPETVIRNKRLSRERAKRLNKCSKYLSMAVKKNKENLDLTNYDTFEKNLSTREDNCRSTLAGNNSRLFDCTVDKTFMIPAIVLIPSTPTNQGSAKKLKK